MWGFFDISVVPEKIYFKVGLDGRNFQFTYFSFIDLVLTDRRCLSGKRPKSASVSFSAERNADTNATEFVTFGFLLYIGFLPLLGKFEPHCLLAIQIFLCFRRHNSRSSKKLLMLRIVKALLLSINNGHQPDRVVLKASDVSAADWLYQQTWKNIVFFHVCCYGFSKGRKSLYNIKGNIELPSWVPWRRGFWNSLVKRSDISFCLFHEDS